MAKFHGVSEFVDTNDNVILTVDPDAGFVNIVFRTAGGLHMMELTNTGSLSLNGAGDDHGARLDGMLGAAILGGAGRVGKIFLRDAKKQDIIVLDATNAAVYVGAKGNEGDVIVRDSEGREVIHLDGHAAVLTIGAEGNEGDIVVNDGHGRPVFAFDSEFAVLRVGAVGNEGDIIVKNDAGKEVIHLDGGSGDIILANADCAEEFDVLSTEAVEPGTVMVLDDNGALQPSAAAYDKKVAGVVSGAGGYKPGIILDRRPSPSARVPLALVGKVYCKADATDTPIATGDLLTTAATPGHAMKASDPLKAFGAVIGKALKPLPQGRGLIPILIALQ